MFETAYEETAPGLPDVKGTRQAETDWIALAEKVGPASLLGRTLADWRAFLFFPLALGVQHGDKTLSVLAIAHGTLFEHPWERAAETMSFNFRFFFEDPVRAGRAVRELHREVEALDENGRRVHPWYEPVWTYCALSTSWAFIAAAEWLNGGLNEHGREEIFDGCMAFCRLVGVNERRLPDNYDALIDYNLSFIEEEMELTEASIRFAELGRNIPAPPKVPMWAWRPVRGGVRHLAKILTGGPLPPLARQKNDMSWGRSEDLQYKALLALARQVDHLPERMRIIPPARRARAAWLAEESARIAATPRTTILSSRAHMSSGRRTT